MSGAIDKQAILIGWASRDVTPDKKVSLRGQFHIRISEKVRDPLTSTALALESADGSEQAILVSLDAVGVSDEVTSGCRDRVKESLPEFDSGKLIISATHTHTAPEQPGFILGKSPPLGDGVMTGEEYGDLLIDTISAAAEEAWNNRARGALSWGKGHAVVGFNRRISYCDGSTQMYGHTDVPEFSHVEGHEDHGVDMLFTYDPEQRLTGMIVNVPCPAQCTEGACFVSADFWHETRAQIREQHGKALFVLPQCSAAGDISPRTLVNRQADARMMELKGYGNEYNEARRLDIADKIAAAVTDVLAPVSKDTHTEVEFAHEVCRLELPERPVTVDHVDTAKSEVATWKAKLEEMKDAEPTSRAYSATFRRIQFNQSVIDRFESQQAGKKTMPVEVHVLRIGGIAICTNRFEYYLDFGERIKARSKALQTLVVQLAGNGTYLPTARALAGGSYGAYIASTPIGPKGGQAVVDECVGAIDGMFGE